MTSETDFDAVVIGAGFSGLRMLHELRGLGLSARVIEAGTDVGGTWYWNRYPGARTDSESWVYCFGFDDDLQQDWTWSARFPAQAEVLAYLEHVADRFDFRRDIEFETRVEAAAYDADANVWEVRTDKGETLRCTYLVTAVGYLSAPLAPPFEGLEDFGGEWYQTSSWPREKVRFTGERVGVVGTGATGVQVIPEVARSAEHVTVFQRTANYVIPNRNHPLEEFQVEWIKDNYESIWELCRNQVFGFPIQRPFRTISDVTPEEHRRVLEAGWESGGFRYIFETFDDLVVDPESNRVAADFHREKVRTIVEDPETAELLCPRDHAIGGKRIPLGHHYYETFNRDNVSLVSVADNPIERITPAGLRLADGTEHELDLLIFAVGFDVGTGALTRIDVRGRDGVSLKEQWEAGPRTYLALAAAGFPNLFMVAGPQTPLVNAPVLIEQQAQWVGRAIGEMREQGLDTMEPSEEAVQEFVDTVQQLLEATLLTDAATVNSYYLGANVPGKALAPLFYFGGAAKYFREIAKVADRDFAGFTRA